MNLTSLALSLAVGGVAGWLAGRLLRGGGFGLPGNIAVGLIGSLIGGPLFAKLGIAAGGLIGSIVTATVGALVLLYVIGLLKRV